MSHVSVRVLTLDSLRPVNAGAVICLKFAEFHDVVQLHAAHFVEDLERVAGHEAPFDYLSADPGNSTPEAWHGLQRNVAAS